MPVKELSDFSEVDQYLAALTTNAGAIRAVSEAIQGTLGPKGLDCMLVDEYGGIIVTNDGVTILKTMDVTHPAARILISAAESQEKQVGDGTTTATVIAGALIAEGVNQIIKGVPVVKVIAGIRYGVTKALELLKEEITLVEDLASPILKRIALVAAREHQEIAELVFQAANIIGANRLDKEGFHLADQIIAIEGRESSLIKGTIINRIPLNGEMPTKLSQARIVIIDDALEPLSFDSESLATEAGFNYQLYQEQEFIKNIYKLADIGVKAVFTDRAISDLAEDLLTELGIIGVQGVAASEWRRLAELTGARPIKKSTLSKNTEDLKRITGEIDDLIIDEAEKLIRIQADSEQNMVTVIIGAYTKEVVAERERIAKDTASALQAAWRGGVVPGGGSIELGIARRLSEHLKRDLACYGYYCVIEALKRPLIQICANAGFNPLEKVEEVWGRQEEFNICSIGIDCDTGKAENLIDLGIWDPYLVKYYAIKTAGEVGEAILRINTIIKMKEVQMGGHHDKETY